MKKFSLLSLAALTFGCAQDGGIGVEGSPAWFMRTTPAQQAAYFGEVCAGYGFTAGTPEMTQCIAVEARNARAEGAANMRAIQAANTFNRPVNTSCRRDMMGNYNCTSY